MRPGRGIHRSIGQALAFNRVVLSYIPNARALDKCRKLAVSVPCSKLFAIDEPRPVRGRALPTSGPKTPPPRPGSRSKGAPARASIPAAVLDELRGTTFTTSPATAKRIRTRRSTAR